ncbi:MAG TPA: aminotransferase class IV, partial [Tepidisphaeraceae bacterium]|nr:aminotransferase class IV [Tepidisphaeraceae bacterium]
CWLNGEVLPLADAKVSVEDRGFQFADGVYESVRLYRGRPFEIDAHLNRLERSCGGIRLPLSIGKEFLKTEILKLVAKSAVSDGLVYLQITRGPSARNHLFPAQLKPTVLFYVRALPEISESESGRSYTLLSVPDERWQKCWIKSIALLENILARNAAAAAGADEAIFVDNGHVTEGTSSNLFMISRGTLITAPVGAKVLPGITRDILLECAKEISVEVEERAMKLEEAKKCAEVFITSSIRELVPVGKWDDEVIVGDGAITRKLHEAYRRRVWDDKVRG